MPGLETTPSSASGHTFTLFCSHGGQGDRVVRPWHRLHFLSLHSEHQRVVRPWYCCPESCGCPIPGGVQGQAGWGPGQPDLVGYNQHTAEGWIQMVFKVLS